MTSLQSTCETCNLNVTRISFFGLTDWHVLLLFLQASILGSCFASQNDRSYSTTCTEQYSSPFICWSSSSRIYQTICLSPSLLLKIPVLASNFYFHNCLEEDVLGVFSSIRSRRRSTYLHIWSLSQHANFSARCCEEAKMALLQITHFRKKVVYQLVICSLHHLKYLSDKILHITTEIILTPSSGFLGEDIGKKEFLSPREIFLQAFDEVHLFLWPFYGILLIF